MPLMKLTDEDRQVLMESLKEVEIDYPQLELLDTIGEGTYGTYTIFGCSVHLRTLHTAQCVCIRTYVKYKIRMYSNLYSIYCRCIPYIVDILRI